MIDLDVTNPITLFTSTFKMFIGIFNNVWSFFPLWFDIIALVPLILMLSYYSFQFVLTQGEIFNEHKPKMIVGVLIMIMIAIVVGVNLIKPVSDAISTDTANATLSATTGIGGALVLIFVTVLILAVVAWMGFHADDTKEKVKEILAKVERNSKKFILKIELASNSNKNYFNNIGNLLGITTIDDIKDTSSYGLYIVDNTLYISQMFDWYITDKDVNRYPNYLSFKVVGLHKKDATKNISFVISKYNDKVSLVEILKEYIDKKLEYKILV